MPTLLWDIPIAPTYWRRDELSWKVRPESWLPIRVLKKPILVNSHERPAASELPLWRGRLRLNRHLPRPIAIHLFTFSICLLLILLAACAPPAGGPDRS